jgi:hypothetical protein
VSREKNFHHRRMSDMTRDEIKLYLDAARAEAKASAADVARSQAELRADLKAGMAAVSVDVANLKIDVSNLKSDFHATFSAHTKWIAAMGFGVVAAVAAINGMFKPEPSPAPLPAPTPYVIYAQPAAPVMQAAPLAAPVSSPSSKGHR